MPSLLDLFAWPPPPGETKAVRKKRTSILNKLDYALRRNREPPPDALAMLDTLPEDDPVRGLVADILAERREEQQRANPPARPPVKPPGMTEREFQRQRTERQMERELAGKPRRGPKPKYPAESFEDRTSQARYRRRRARRRAETEAEAAELAEQGLAPTVPDLDPTVPAERTTAPPEPVYERKPLPIGPLAGGFTRNAQGVVYCQHGATMCACFEVEGAPR